MKPPRRQRASIRTKSYSNESKVVVFSSSPETAQSILNNLRDNPCAFEWRREQVQLYGRPDRTVADVRTGQLCSLIYQSVLEVMSPPAPMLRSKEAYSGALVAPRAWNACPALPKSSLALLWSPWPSQHTPMFRSKYA